MEDPKGWPDIYSAALDCDELFRKCLMQIAEPRAIRLFGDDAITAFGGFARCYHQRFEAWSTYLGALSKQELCLDRRLSKRKKIRDMIIELLDMIFRNLRYFLQITEKDNKERVTRSLTRRTEILAAELIKRKESITEAMIRLNELGEIIRRSSTGSLPSRVRAFSAKRSYSSLEEISFLMVKFLYPTAALSLQRLLGRSILERYVTLKYQQEHQRRLATRRSLVLDEEEDKPQVHNDDPELLEPITRKDHVDLSPIVARDDSETRVDEVLSESGSKASTLQANEFHLRLKKNIAALSTISRTSSVPMASISYPEPPKPSADGESSWAVCCWCSEPHPYDKFQDARWWKRHVDYDLQPYVCLVDTCSTSLYTFDKFSLWMKHMEEHHSPDWITEMNHKVMWKCRTNHESPQFFDDKASLRDHMMKDHLDIFTESNIRQLVRTRPSVRIPGSEYVCPLCGFDSSQAPLVEAGPEVLRHSSRTKRKRQSKCGTHTELDASAQQKRRKLRFQDEGEMCEYGSMSSDESDLELASSLGAESISPELMDRLRRKRLLRHIATHLKALSFMSLRLDALYEQPGKGDESTATGDEHEDTSERGEPREINTDLDALSLNFNSDRPPSPASPGANFANNLKLSERVSAIFDGTASNSDDTEGGDNAKPALISSLEYIPDQSPVARVNSWIRSVEPFAQKNISPKLSERSPAIPDNTASNSDNIEGGDDIKPALISSLEYIPDQSPVASWVRSVELFVQKNILPNKLDDGEIKILLIDHWADVSQSASKVQQSGSSPVRQNMSCDYLENARGSLMAQMIHRMCPHAKLLIVKSGGIDQITMTDGVVNSGEIDQVTDGAERAAKAIEWAIKQDVQIILMTGNLTESKENAEGIRNLDKQLQQAAAANICLYCTAADSDSYSGGTEPYPHRFDRDMVRVVGSATEAGNVSQFVDPRSFHYLFPGEGIPGADNLKDSSAASALAAGFAALILWCFAYQHPRPAKNDYKGPDAEEMHEIFKALQKEGNKWVDVTTLFNMDGSAAIQGVVDYCFAARGN